MFGLLQKVTLPLVATGFVLLELCTSSAVAASSRDAQRESFKQALEALSDDKLGDFYASEKGLRRYVLHDYLRFALAERAIEEQSLGLARTKALRLEKEFSGNFLAWRVMRAYRARLRKEEQWRLLLDSAQLPSAPAMRCETLRAKAELGELAANDPQLIALWEKRGWAKDCAWVAERELAAGRVTSKHLWSHLYALMNAGRLQQVDALKQHFSASDKAVIDAWQKGHKSPEQALADSRWHENTAFNRRVFKHLISRLSRTDAAAARLAWGKARSAERYDEETLNAAARTLTMRAAGDYHPKALDWLRWLPVEVQDKASREARVRLAVRMGDWSEVLDAVDALSSEEKQLTDWRYWGAVALMELGNQQQAEEIFEQLADKRSYYGFLAADRVSKPYQMHFAATTQNKELRSALQARADVQRMREYLFVGLRGEARAEWNTLTKKLDQAQLQELALLTLDWGWFDRAIVAYARSGGKDDLRVRFPFAFKQAITEQAAKRELDIEWVYAVARQESRFQPEVSSGAGAVGLMQIMPATAKDLARRMKKKLYIGALDDPEFNVSLGAYYLRYLLDRFDGQEVLATAAYNAGLSRIPRWYGESPMAADRWVESIPYKETRGYVKAVMAYLAVYDWRADGVQDVRLTQRMPMVPAKSP